MEYPSKPHRCFNITASLAAVAVLALCPQLVLSQTRGQSTLAAQSVLRAGEVRFDGRVRLVEVQQKHFWLNVSSMTTSQSRSQMTLPAQGIPIQVTANTVLVDGLRPARRVTIADIKPGMSVAVVMGQDVDASGYGVPAQKIILNAFERERSKIAPRPAAKKTLRPPSASPLASPSSPSKTLVRPSQLPNIRSGGFRVRVNGRSYSGTLVQVHLDTVRIKVGLGRNQVGLTESLASMARRHGALAGINGSYFQAYNHGDHKPPVMTLITGGTPVFTGNIGTTLGFTSDNEARMDRATTVLNALGGTSSNYASGYGPTGYGAAGYGATSNSGSNAASAFRSRVQEAVGCGPRLVQDGRIALDMHGEKFSDPKVLVLSTARSAVGLTRDRRLLLVTTAGTIPQLAGIMKALGAHQAMNLDGGASSGLWLRGRYLRSPGRNLSNALLILPR